MGVILLVLIAVPSSQATYGPVLDEGTPAPALLDFPKRPVCQTEALLDSMRLPESPTILEVWRPNRAYGTPELIDALQIAAQEMEWMLPEAEPIVVGDLSKKRGGVLQGHRSHRGGARCRYRAVLHRRESVPTRFCRSESGPIRCRSQLAVDSESAEHRVGRAHIAGPKIDQCTSEICC